MARGDWRRKEPQALMASSALTYNHRNRPATLKLSGSDAATYRYNEKEQLALRTTLAPLSPAGVIRNPVD
jgi:hypothetical protein